MAISRSGDGYGWWLCNNCSRAASLNKFCPDQWTSLTVRIVCAITRRSSHVIETRKISNPWTLLLFNSRRCSKITILAVIHRSLLLFKLNWSLITRLLRSAVQTSMPTCGTKFVSANSYVFSCIYQIHMCLVACTKCYMDRWSSMLCFNQLLWAICYINFNRELYQVWWLYSKRVGTFLESFHAWTKCIWNCLWMNFSKYHRPHM